MAPENGRRALVFVRRSNDIDHLAPIAYALGRRGWGVTVLSQDPFADLADDFRLRYLTELGVVVACAYRFNAPTLRHRVVATIICRRPGRSLPVRLYRRFVSERVFRRVVRTGLYDELWAEGLLDRVRPTVLIFDHSPPTRYATAAIITAAHRRGLPIVAEPHGTHMLVNELRATSRAETGRFGNVDIFESYDHVVVMEPLIASFFARMGVPPSKVVTLGSARYCDEWRRVLERIAPPRRSPPVDARGKLKLVYMDKQARERVHQDRIDAEIGRIASRRDVTLVIKPETRSNTVSSDALRRAAFIADGLSSAELIEWADAVMVSHSSIAIEVLLQNKTLLHSSYFHDNLTMFEEMGACWALRSPLELDSALTRLAADPHYRPYSASNVARFLTQVVDAGCPGRDVLADHADFVERVAVQTPVMSGRTAS